MSRRSDSCWHNGYLVVTPINLILATKLWLQQRAATDKSVSVEPAVPSVIVNCLFQVDPQTSNIRFSFSFNRGRKICVFVGILNINGL